MGKAILTAALTIMLTGCINITTELRPVNEAVKPVLKGHDCTTIAFGIGLGTNRMSEALRTGYAQDDEFEHAPRAIRTIHSVTLTDTAFLNLGGSRCLEVTGEP